MWTYNMNKIETDRMTELLLKIVKLQRFMRFATKEQSVRVYEVAEPVIAELERKFGGDRTWITALMTFGNGQYFGQSTKYWIGDNMDERTIKDCLRREIY